MIHLPLEDDTYYTDKTIHITKHTTGIELEMKPYGLAGAKHRVSKPNAML